MEWFPLTALWSVAHNCLESGETLIPLLGWESSPFPPSGLQETRTWHYSSLFFTCFCDSVSPCKSPSNSSPWTKYRSSVAFDLRMVFYTFNWLENVKEDFGVMCENYMKFKIQCPQMNWNGNTAMLIRVHAVCGCFELPWQSGTGATGTIAITCKA